MTQQAIQHEDTDVARKQVLVVDDDAIMREVMCEALAAAGFEAVHAENGEVACGLLQAQDFDLAVIDLSMPKFDGFELLAHIRNSGRAADLPVIVATSFNDRDSIERAYQLGASSFVTKPVNWPQFAHHALFVMRSGETERALRHARGEAEAASLTKNWLFRVLSHELKTPLAALIGLTGVLGEALGKKVDEEEAEYLDHVVGAAERLNGIISDVLILSKALAGASQQQLTSTPIGEILDDSMVGLKAKARGRGISLLGQTPDGSQPVICDPLLLRQALHKLVDNAIKFSPPGGSVDIRADMEPDGTAVISVRDRGPGLSVAQLQACLRPFVQNDMSYSRPADGLGLGLPIAKAIAEAHGGGLQFFTAPGAGLQVTIRLPRR